MSRQLRQFEIGGIYHIISRGVDGRKLFIKNQDYSRFVIGLEFFNAHDSINLWPLLARVGSDPTIAGKTIGERLAIQRAKNSSPLVELMAFALMPNHYHLIVREIVDEGISTFMKKMGGYTTYFNKQYVRMGTLFQSRFKAVSILDDRQLMAAFAYVHTNPVELYEPGWKNFKVRNVKSALRWLEEYRWSSFRDYIGSSNFPTVTKRVFFLDFFGSMSRCRETVDDWVKYKARREDVDVGIFE